MSIVGKTVKLRIKMNGHIIYGTPRHARRLVSRGIAEYADSEATTLKPERETAVLPNATLRG